MAFNYNYHRGYISTQVHQNQGARSSCCCLDLVYRRLLSISGPSALFLLSVVTIPLLAVQNSHARLFGGSTAARGIEAGHNEVKSTRPVPCIPLLQTTCLSDPNVPTWTCRSRTSGHFSSTGPIGLFLTTMVSKSSGETICIDGLPTHYLAIV